MLESLVICFLNKKKNHLHLESGFIYYRTFYEISIMVSKLNNLKFLKSIFIS